MLFSLLITGAAVLLSGLVSAQTSGACSGSCQGVSHDPNVVRRASDGTFFRFSTGGGINIATAPAIQGPWTYKGVALPSGSSINLSGNTDLWAPDVTLVGSYYYMFYAVSSFGSQNSAIGVARSTTMDVGTWQDLGSTGITSSSSKAYNAIDPNLIKSGSNYYLTFGSFWHDLYQVQMASTPTTSAGGSSYNVAYNSSGSHAQEGSFILQNGAYYYLFFSSGICCGYDTSRPAPGEEYRINVCRSTSVSGSFVDKNGVSCLSGGGTTVLASSGTRYGPGGQGVLTDNASGNYYLYYHYVNTNVGYADGQKTFGWNILDFSTGWPIAKSA